MSHRCRLGVAQLDACSLRKRILAGAVPSARSIPGPCSHASPGELPSTAPKCLRKMVNAAAGQAAQVCMPSSSRLTCSDLSRGSSICPFLSGFHLPGEKGEKGLGKGKHSLGSCKSWQPKG